MARARANNKKEVEHFLPIAQEAAFKAGELLRRNLNRSQRIDYKGVVNLVTDCDRQSQKLITSHLLRAFPDHGMLAEEDEFTCPGKGPYRWFVDPLDGTTNFAHRFPIFCVSIALEREGEPILGVVYDPMRSEMFWAVRGRGAYLNGRPIRVSTTANLDQSLLATGFPYDLREDSTNNLIHFENFLFRVQAIRRCGSAALDLCYVACGRFDGFWELKLKPWDVVAGALIVLEAGGRVTDFRGHDFKTNATDIAASNGLIHRSMLQVLALGLEKENKKQALSKSSR